MWKKRVHLAMTMALGVLALFFVGPLPAQAAGTVQLLGASVRSSTQVKLSFNQPLSSAAAAQRYAISPQLAVTAAALTDRGYAVLLTTAVQTNAVVYAVTASDLTGVNGEVMAGPGQAVFIGTPLGANTKTSMQDDFNRPSGLVPADVPIGGPWYTVRVNPGNSYGITATPALLGGDGDGAFWSHVTNTSAETDNADVYYKISGSDYYLSAYVLVPSGQAWAPTEIVGLMRLDQYYDTAHARISAFAESPAGYTLRVDWKSTGNKYFSKLPAQLGVEPLVASGVSFDTWHWLQLHVKNSATTGAPGVVEVWLDGALAFQQSTLFVYNRTMTYAELGIMHMVTPGPPATTITDQVRLGTTFQPPSL